MGFPACRGPRASGIARLEEQRPSQVDTVTHTACAKGKIGSVMARATRGWETDRGTDRDPDRAMGGGGEKQPGEE